MRLTEFLNMRLRSTCFEPFGEACTCTEKYSKIKLVLATDSPGVLMIFHKSHQN